MMPFEAMEPQRLAFLYELYKRSEGDPRQGVPYEELIDALGFNERVTKRIQRALQQEGLVELSAVPRMTDVGRPVMDREHRRSGGQTIGMTHRGVWLYGGHLVEAFAPRTCPKLGFSIFVVIPHPNGGERHMALEPGSPVPGPRRGAASITP